MALEALGGDPCSRLNSSPTSGFPTLWIPASTPIAGDSTVFPILASGGNPQSFLQILNDVPSANRTGRSFLINPDPSSKFRLLQFMSGGGIGAVGTSLDSFLLKTSSGAVETIIDTYVIGSSPGIGKTGYTSGFGQVLSDAEIDRVRDALIGRGYLLSQAEIFNQQQMVVTDTSTVSTDSATLLFLSKLEQSSTSLSTAQQARKTLLESKNLRFYAAFLAEYCFYRTRYQWLLQKYFTVYNANPYTPPNLADTNGAVRIFNGNGNGLNQYSGSSVSRDDYIKVLAYHMAIINTRMFDLRRLLSSINTYYSQLFTQIQNTINDQNAIGSNNDLTQTINALQASSVESKKYLEEAQYRQGLVKYTQEKNRYSNILLSLYAVLNVAALAMIYKLK